MFHSIESFVIIQWWGAAAEHSVVTQSGEIDQIDLEFIKEQHNPTLYSFLVAINF